MKNPIHSSATARKIILLLACLSLIPALAQAHHLPAKAGSFASGLGHPLHGWDHILAMVAVGLWAAQLGGRALWAVPAAFVSLMTVGGILGFLSIPVPMVESGVIVSVLVMGILVAAAARLPLVASVCLVGTAALFHGHAHGTEIPVSASGLAYGLGFVMATSLLHACGIALGLLAQKRISFPVLRFAGAAIVLAGVCLWLN